LIPIVFFEILLSTQLVHLGVRKKTLSSPGWREYDHQLNFSGLELNSIIELRSNQEEIELKVSANNLAHLILSDKKRYLIIKKNYGAVNLQKQVKDKVAENMDNDVAILKANIYYTIYKEHTIS